MAEDATTPVTTPTTAEPVTTTSEPVTTTRTNPYSGMSIAEISAARAAKRASYGTSRTDRMAELKAQREASALQRALARAASDPQFNFTQRPEGFIDPNTGVIGYYGWNGGRTSGRWMLRVAPYNEENYRKYATRVPAQTYAIQDIRSVARPVSDIFGNKQIPNGFSVDKSGKIVTYGKTDQNILKIKSEYEAKGVSKLRDDREKVAFDRAMQRAQTDWRYNFMKRPAGKVTDKEIRFWSWVGGKESGEWVLFQAENDKDGYNLQQYSNRASEMDYFPPTSIRDVLIPYKALGVIPNPKPGTYTPKYRQPQQNIITE